MGLFRTNIGRRVRRAIEDKILDGQKEFDQEARIADEHFADGVQSLSEACSNTKTAAEDRIVNNILG